LPLLDREVLEKYEEAGRIASKVRKEIARVVKEGMRIIEVCEMAEAVIRRLGGKPAFPCNVSVNDVAAHYTSPPGDERRIPRKSVVKIDVGVHIDGYIADTAVTVCFNQEYMGMLQASRLVDTQFILVNPYRMFPTYPSERSMKERFTLSSPS